MVSQSQHRQSISCASTAPGDNGFPAISSSPIESARIGEVKRETKETNVSVKINLDGNGVADSSTGIPFLDHMLDQLSSHGLFDVHVKATGDIHIDDHHTNEDVALAIGTALLKALGDRKGINFIFYLMGQDLRERFNLNDGVLGITCFTVSFVHVKNSHYFHISLSVYVSLTEAVG